MSFNSFKYPDEKELVSRVLNGDSQAFGIIIKSTERLVAQITFKMVINPEDRKDLAQDVYLKAYKNLSGFKFQSKLSTWIAQIAYNTCFNHLEKKKLLLPESTSHDDADSNDILEILAMKSPGFEFVDNESTYLKKDLKRIVMQEMEKLSPIFKTLITLFHYEELSYDEICTITGLPEGTIKSYLFRARKNLKDSILLKYKKEELS